MNIYPAIDLKAGQCVRLYQGSYDQVTVYDQDPIKLALSFVEQGAKILHVVDLDGAKLGKPVQSDLIAMIKKTSKASIQMGGGIRTHQQIEGLFDKGIDRIVLWTVQSNRNKYPDADSKK